MTRHVVEAEQTTGSLAIARGGRCSCDAHPAEANGPDRRIVAALRAQWADPADSRRAIGWARGLFDAMRPHLQDAVYVNNLGAEGVDRVRAAYGQNYQPLAKIKATHEILSDQNAVAGIRRAESEMRSGEGYGETAVRAALAARRA